MKSWCYLGVFVLGILGALRRVLVAATFVLMLVLVELAVVSDWIQVEQVHGGGLTARQGLPFLCWFLGGSTVYFERGRLSWSKGALLIAAAVTTLAAVLGVMIGDVVPKAGEGGHRG